MELGLGEQLQLLEVIPLQDVQNVYRIARMTVIPTPFEGWSGIPVFEAMALGSPLATSRACGIPEAVSDAGLLFDGLDVANMAQALKRLWLDENLRKGLAAQALIASAARTWDRAAQTYAGIYTEARTLWMRDHGGIS
ncbi:MAG: glycosyltransferase [Holophagaceae bacterium]|nr:glycosyltransferase [Holophagaceae bacterium]